MRDEWFSRAAGYEKGAIAMKETQEQKAAYRHKVLAPVSAGS